MRSADTFYCFNLNIVIIRGSPSGMLNGIKFDGSTNKHVIKL